MEDITTKDCSNKTEKNDKRDAMFRVVHERQSRQLCAMHAVNNLLQLSKKEGGGEEVDDEDQGKTKVDIEKNADSLCEDADNETNERDEDRYARCILVCNNGQQEKDNFDIDGENESNNMRIFLLDEKEPIMKAATTAEFDSIADEMTMAEYRVMKEFETATTVSASGDDDDEDDGGAVAELSEGESNHGMDAADRNNDEKEKENINEEQLSYLQVLRSNHRTPMLGNYSFEVMETCLKRRGVELSWYRSSQEPFLTNNDDIFIENELKPKENKDGFEEEGKEALEEGITIGFIVNLNVDNASNTSFFGSVKWYLRRIPLVGGYFGGGRHWFAITRLRSVVTSSQSDDDMKNLTANMKEEYSSAWLIMDSESDDIKEIQSDLELKDYLDEILNDGGNAFRATMTRPLLLVDR